MDKEQYRKAADYWVTADSSNNKMPCEELQQHIDDYITANDTCALATGSGEYIRCTPIEYVYRAPYLYIFTEGGKKFLGLEINKNVSISIFDKFTGFSTLKGMQITGLAEVIAPDTEEYLRAAGLKRLNLKALNQRNHFLYLLRVTIKSIEFTNADFKKRGYDTRQSIDYI